MLDKYLTINQTTLRMLELYRNDYSKLLHVRQISREIDVDVKATQLQLKKLEKLNVLSSTFKGKNKEYSLNLGNTITPYFIILAEIFRTMTYLLKNFEIKKLVQEENDMDGIVILFGSFARGEENKDSDVDLLQVVTNRRSKRSEGVSKRMEETIGRNISLKVTTKVEFMQGLRSGDPLIREVASNHIVLRGTEDFCKLMWKYYGKR